MRILVANPNLTQAVTDTAVAEARYNAAPGTEIIGATGAFGVGIVSTAAESAIAAHAALEMLAQHVGQVDAAILAISFDSGLTGAQELMPFPVIGLTAAALNTACLIGRRFGLITFGIESRWLYLDLVRDYGLSERMVGCETVPVVSATAFLDTSRQDLAVRQAACRLHTQGAATVVIAGVAIAGMARRLQPHVPVQLLDGIPCAIRLAEAIVGLGVHPTRLEPLLKPSPPQGIGAALATLLQPPPSPPQR